MTLSVLQTNPVASCGAIFFAAAGLLLGVDGWGQASFLGDDPIQVTPKVLADDGKNVKMGPVLVQEKSSSIAADEVAILRAQVEKERKRREAAEAKLSALTVSLAEANRVREEQTKAHQELQLKTQAFGVDLLKADPKAIEQRLLKAVRSLDVTQQTNEKLVRELTSLSEVLVNTASAVPELDETLRKQVDTALQSANQLLGQTAGPEIRVNRKLTEGKVVSIDAEVGLIVLNIGRNSGARIGMPIEVMREDRSIGTALVVDVREKICGAILREMTAEGVDVKIGDNIRPRPDEGGA